MAHVKYEIVEHDGGWAYRVDGVYSETFPDHDAARAAAHHAASAQMLGGQTAGIVYETADGQWREEVADGGDRPQTEVEG